MARLIVLDASVVIAALASHDPHHPAARGAINSARDDELVLASTTRTEMLVGPYRVGGEALDRARDFVDDCATVPVTTPIADGAAQLRAIHRALSIPDAIALVVADMIDADALWTFDRRWASVDPRVTVP